MAEASCSSLSSGPVPDRFVDLAQEIAQAAIALGRRVIEVRRGHDPRGRALLLGSTPLEPEWSRLLEPLRGLEPILPRVTGTLFEPLKAQLRAIARRVNRCQPGRPGGMDNLLHEWGPEFFTEGWNLGEALKGFARTEPPCIPWAEQPPPGCPPTDHTPAARALWGRDPVAAFERLRDRTCEVIQWSNEVYRCAAGAAPDQPLAAVGEEFHDQLYQALAEAQAFWFDTPAARYLDRVEGPVYLHGSQPPPAVTVSGSCYHYLGMSIASGLWQGIGGAQPGGEYVRLMRLRTAAGSEVAQHLASLVPLVRCECQQAIVRWRAEITAAPVPHPLAGRPAAESAPSSSQQARSDSDTPPQEPHLSDRQYEILQALELLKAFGCASKQRTTVIARRAEGVEANPEAFKEPIAALRRRGLIDTKAGRGGGCWLTPAGRAIVARLRETVANGGPPLPPFPS